MKAARRAPWLAGALLALAGCQRGGGPVARTYDGMVTQGRRIPAAAYADYTEGTMREARGDHAGAAAAYARALDADPRSPELWTLYAALTCRNDPSDVQATFEEALELASEYGPTWLAMSECHSARGEQSRAVETALRAAALMPWDERATVRVVDALRASGELARARLWLHAWRARMGAYPAALDATGQRANEAPPSGDPIDAALSRGDLAAARRHATQGRVTAGQLALRAARLGKPTVALAQATLGLDADPDDVDAWVGALVAADLTRDEEALRSWLGRAPTETDASTEALEALAALVERRAGRAAADAFRTGAKSGNADE